MNNENSLKELGIRAKEAAKALRLVSDADKEAALKAMAAALLDNQDAILSANALDVKPRVKPASPLP